MGCMRRIRVLLLRRTGTALLLLLLLLRAGLVARRRALLSQLHPTFSPRHVFLKSYAVPWVFFCKAQRTEETQDAQHHHPHIELIRLIYGGVLLVPGDRNK